MADWIYCGSDPPVDAAGTQSLLRTHHAIWCSPPGLRPWPGTPEPGDRIWLLWANVNGTTLLHTNSDIDGVRDEAVGLGYGGGLGMSFLRVENVVFPATERPPVTGLGVVPTALSQATEYQSEALVGMLPV